MPCASFSLPAGKSCPWAQYGQGAICGQCYAEKGNYRYRGVQQAQLARFEWTRESMKTAAGREQWVNTMVQAIQSYGLAYFRIHDSGDVFSAVYVECWLRVAQQLPNVRFWLPTRAWQNPHVANGPFPVLTETPVLPVLRKLASQPNVTVRPSALRFGEAAPVVAGLHAGSTADGPGFRCPVPQQHNECGSCRACWTAQDQPVSYRKH